MTQKQEQIEAKDAPPVEQPSSDTEYDDFNVQALDPQSDFDLEEEYLNKLKIQRRRIEELSLLHSENQERIQREIQKNRTLNEEIQRLSAAKDYQSRYTEVISSLDITTQENKTLKDQLSDLRQQLFQSSSEKANLIQKLRNELDMQREKESSKLENLQDELSSKQEEIDKLTRDLRNRERELQDVISNLKIKMSTMEQEHFNSLKVQQRRIEKLERDLQSRNSVGSQNQLNYDTLLRENVQLKEENFRLAGELKNKEMELNSQYEKYKVKFNSMKKDLKAKEKECSEYKESLRKYEKEANQYTSETQTLKTEVRKLKETFQSDRSRWESDFSKEKQSLQLVIDRQNLKIHELQSDNKYLLEQNKRLQAILRKKENAQKQRKYLLKTEMKEIDKLEKVIDRIVE